MRDHICGSKMSEQWNENGAASVFYLCACFGSALGGVLQSPLRVWTLRPRSLPGAGPESSRRRARCALVLVGDFRPSWVGDVVVYVCLSVVCVSCGYKSNLLSVFVPGRENEHKRFRKESFHNFHVLWCLPTPCVSHFTLPWLGLCAELNSRVSAYPSPSLLSSSSSASRPHRVAAPSLPGGRASP